VVAQRRVSTRGAVPRATGGIGDRRAPRPGNLSGAPETRTSSPSRAVTHAPTGLPHVAAAAAASRSSPVVPRCPGRWRGGGLGGRALPTPQHGRWRRVCTLDWRGGGSRARVALSRGALVLDSQRRHLVLDCHRHSCYRSWTRRGGTATGSTCTDRRRPGLGYLPAPASPVAAPPRAARLACARFCSRDIALARCCSSPLVFRAAPPPSRRRSVYLARATPRA
jgi:hypothetical protein